MISNEPGRELRFTRTRQASWFWCLAAVLIATGVTLVATSSYRSENPSLPHPAWALIPFLAGFAVSSLAFKLTKHAYLIVTPLGIEIFPFFRPAHGMRLVTWAEIHSAELDSTHTRLTLHHDEACSSGVHLSLHPIDPQKRELLSRAVLSRLQRNHAESA